MARRQTEIPDAKAERKAMKQRETQLHVELIVTMREHKVKKHVYRDETGVKREVVSEIGEPKIRSRKLPDETAKSENKLPEHHGAGGENGVHPGLIDQAMKAQADDANVEVTSDGDVAVPETSAKKARKGKARN